LLGRGPGGIVVDYAAATQLMLAVS
jgi:hypothetical protein